MIENLLTELGKNGPWAILLALAIIAIVFLFNRYTDSIKKNDELQEKRLADYKEMKDIVLELLKSIKQTTDTTLQSLLTKRKGR
jgi:hypothetical protein